MRKFILVVAAITFIASAAVAQSTLYVGLSNSKGYVVGAKLQESGLFRYGGDSTWVHLGWNHPFISGVAYGGSSGTWHLSGGNGALRSTDNGKTWAIKTDWRVTEAQHIAVDHFDPSLVYLATSYGIWRSVDDGQHWYESSLGFAENYTQAIVTDITAARRALAATEGGVYVSEDAAERWVLVGPAVPMIDLAQSGADPSHWIAGSRSGKVFLSSDGGQTWTESFEAGSEVTGVAADPSDSSRFAFVTYGSGAFQTDDGGMTWQPVGEDLPTPFMVETIFDPNVSGRLWIATKEEGIFFRDAGAMSWTYAGMTGTMVFDMVFVDQ